MSDIHQYKPIECVNRTCTNIIYVLGRNTHMLLQCENCVQARQLKAQDE